MNTVIMSSFLFTMLFILLLFVPCYFSKNILLSFHDCILEADHKAARVVLVSSVLGKGGGEKEQGRSWCYRERGRYGEQQAVDSLPVSRPVSLPV